MEHNYHRLYGRIANANTSIAEAWEISNSGPIREDYEWQAKFFNWQDKILQQGPHWAYWFARHVICDHWPVAEQLIKQDAYTLQLYNNYVGCCRLLRILGKSVGDEPLPKRPTIAKLNDLADKIAEEVEIFRKKRKLQTALREGAENED
jgi:hypothetical protein